jgi:D-alanine-D-alanine ligase
MIARLSSVFLTKFKRSMRKNVAILAGGDSGEYEVSINSSRVIRAHIDESLFRAFIILISGKLWEAVLDDGRRVPVDKNDFSIHTGEEKIGFDVVFMAIHGPPGEDGRMQGYLDMMGIPYTTCSHDTSALCFNKKFSSRYARQLGILTAHTHYLRKGDRVHHEKILNEVGLPCFVKPLRSGSSLGVTKVKLEKDFASAIEKAFEEDTEIAVESFLDGMELTCGILDSPERMHVFPLTEIVPVNEFFDYESKYTRGMADEITPARIDEATEKLVKDTYVFLYRKFSCQGLVRFDFINTREGLFFIEANTVPGLSEASIVPQQANAMGMSTQALFTAMLGAALGGN